MEVYERIKFALWHATGMKGGVEIRIGCAWRSAAGIRWPLKNTVLDVTTDG